MPNNQTAADIAGRFAAERYEIHRHIEFLKTKSEVTVVEIVDHNLVLTANGIAPLPVKDYLGIPPNSITLDELEALLPEIQSIRPLIDKAISAVNHQVDEIDPFSEVRVVDDNYSLVAEWTEYALSGLSDAPSLQELRDKRASINPSHLALNQESFELSESDITAIVDEAFVNAAHHALQRRLDQLQFVLDRFAELEIVAKSNSIDSTTSIYRLGFIALMAAFDAAIFDLVRVALHSRFFELARAFNNDSYKMKQITDAGSFDAFKEHVISSQLARRYVKGLLYLLKNAWKVECVNKQSGDKFEQLVELVARRNLHLHARGIVGELYLRDSKNCYKLKIGATAYIDSAYLQRAMQLTSYCIRQVAVCASK